MLMTRDLGVIARISCACGDLASGMFQATSLHHLAQTVGKLSNLNYKTVTREFQANPDRYPIERLLRGHLPAGQNLSNFRPGQGSSDQPVRPVSDSDLSKTCPRPVQPRTLPEAPLGEPVASACPHAPEPPAASTLGSALPGSLPAPPQGSAPWYSKLAGPARWDTECFICHRWIPGRDDSGEGQVFGHAVHPFDSKLGIHSKFLCLEPECRTLHQLSVIVDNAGPF